MTRWTKVASLASFSASGTVVVAVVLLNPDGDGTAGLALGVALDAALICMATSLFAAFLRRG